MYKREGPKAAGVTLIVCTRDFNCGLARRKAMNAMTRSLLLSCTRPNITSRLRGRSWEHVRARLHSVCIRLPERSMTRSMTSQGSRGDFMIGRERSGGTRRVNSGPGGRKLMSGSSLLDISTTTPRPHYNRGTTQIKHHDRTQIHSRTTKVCRWHALSM